ncbi:TPA: hypothetical protein NP420_002430 [Klebsiella pneumoniae]|nr:hypothetical protein [Klebsiella pneumoniae]
MKRIAIVGMGPTGIYTFYELVKRGEPLAITHVPGGGDALPGLQKGDTR